MIGLQLAFILSLDVPTDKNLIKKLLQNYDVVFTQTIGYNGKHYEVALLHTANRYKLIIPVIGLNHNSP